MSRRMNVETDERLERRLLRLLHEEAPPGEAADTRRLLEEDPSAAARYRELERLWSALDLAPPEPADESLLAGVRARLARGEAESALGLWGLAPAWERAAAAAVLVSGIGVGAWLGAGVAAADEASFDVEPSLAESYWSAVESGTFATEDGVGMGEGDSSGPREER